MTRYAYEVDGRGGQLTGFDDANMPSLLGIPLLGYQHYNREVYANTRAFILSDRNPYFFSGVSCSVTVCLELALPLCLPLRYACMQAASWLALARHTRRRATFGHWRS